MEQKPKKDSLVKPLFVSLLSMLLLIFQNISDHCRPCSLVTPPFRSCLPQLRASLPFVRLTLAVIFRSCLLGLVQNLVGASSMFDFCTSPVIFLVALVGSHNLQPGVREICMQRNDLPHGNCTRRLATSTKPSIDAKFHKYVSQPERLVVTTTRV